MARRYRFQPAGHLLGTTPGPSSDDNRRDSDRSQPADQRDLVLGVLQNVNLAPAPESRRSSG
eukprot:6853934-Alexandrium_andersonii.AAC.1